MIAADSAPSSLIHDSRWNEQLLPLVHCEFPIALCWSAKGGCTTVLKWFLAHNGLLQKALSHDPWVHNYRSAVLFEQPGYRQQCERLFGRSRADKFIVKVIRDPARRAFSGYLHFLRWEHAAGWDAPASVHNWKNKAGLKRQRGISFRQFLRYLASEQQRARAIDLHFRPQFEPLQDARVHAHIPLEHLAAGFRNLERRFWLPHVDVWRLSDSSHHNTPTNHCAWPELPATFPADLETLEKFGTPSAEAFLDPETLAIVHQVYRVDYEAYGSVYPVETAIRATRLAA